MELREILRQRTVLQHQGIRLVYPPKKNTGSASQSHKPSLQSTADDCLLWHSRIRATRLSARTLSTPHWILCSDGDLKIRRSLLGTAISIGCGSPSSAGSGPENILSHSVLYASIAAVAAWPWISQLRPGTLQMQQSEPDRGLETGQAAGVTGRVDHPGVAVRNADGE